MQRGPAVVSWRGACTRACGGGAAGGGCGRRGARDHSRARGEAGARGGRPSPRRRGHRLAPGGARPPRQLSPRRPTGAVSRASWSGTSAGTLAAECWPTASPGWPALRAGARCWSPSRASPEGCVPPATRAGRTAIHLVERVLPRAPYRQWTLSLPMPVRFCLARDARLLSEVLRLFVRALLTFQRRAARRLGVARPLTGAVAFVQRFGSALQLTPHFHVLVPEAVFEELDGAECVSTRCLGPPTPRWRHSPSPWPVVSFACSTLEAPSRSRPCRMERSMSSSSKASGFHGAGRVLPRAGLPAAVPSPEGFSLHADTWLHENDVVGLERLCNCGARGPLSLERLSALPDGRLAYRMKRASPTGETHLVLAPVAFLRPGGRARPAPQGQPASATSGSSPPTPGCVPASCPRLLPPRRSSRQLPAPWRRSLSGPLGLATPSPGPSSSSGPSRPTSSPALAAGAPAASWQSFSVPRAARAILEHLRLPSRPLPLAPATSPPQLGLW